MQRHNLALSLHLSCVWVSVIECVLTKHTLITSVCGRGSWGLWIWEGGTPPITHSLTLCLTTFLWLLLIKKNIPTSINSVPLVSFKTCLIYLQQDGSPAAPKVIKLLWVWLWRHINIKAEKIPVNKPHLKPQDITVQRITQHAGNYIACIQ